MKPKPKSLGQVLRDAIQRDLCSEQCARAVIREYERRQWMPVSVRPKALGEYLILTKSGSVHAAYYNDGWNWKLSHWRPMPKGPR